MAISREVILQSLDGDILYSFRVSLKPLHNNALPFGIIVLQT